MDRDERSEKHYPFNLLSKRELEITVAMAVGWAPQETAEVLGIAVKSYSTYRCRVMEKLRIRTNAQLAVMAFEAGIVPSVLNRWKEIEREYITRNGGGSLPETGRGSRLLPGAEDQSEGQQRDAEIPSNDECDESAGG